MRRFDITDDHGDRIVFGAGAEARAAEALSEAGAERVLLVALAHHRDGAERVAAALGSRAVGIFDDVKQHVPLEQAERARAMARGTSADWVVSHGGGTATGFAKAIALTEGVRVGAIPTTYAGSERTSIWGLTSAEGKRTGRDERVRPSLVVYDPALTAAVPREVSLQSLFNALCHSVAELTSTSSADHAAAAREAIQQVLRAMDLVAAQPDDPHARAEALYGAYLASASIERAELGLHHKLVHTLGGTFGTNHAAAHTAVLPYATAYNAEAVPALLDALGEVLGDDPTAALYDRARDWGLPHSLKGLGLSLDDLPRLVGQALERPYPNPRPIGESELQRLASDAYHARRPSRHSRSRHLPGEGPHAALVATERGAPLEQARAVLIALHGRGAAADRITRDLEAFLGPVGSELREHLCVIAPQALDNAWYPKGFTAPLAENQPFLDSALSMVDAAYRHALASVDPARVVIAGFSQGACLLLAWARQRTHMPGALLLFSGAELDVPGTYDALATSRVVLAKSEGDPYLPPERFARTAEALRGVVPDLEVRIVPGDGHGLTDEDGHDLVRAVRAALG